MAASVQFRPQNRDLGMVMREVDEDLAIFLGTRNGENDMNDHLLVEEDSDEFNVSTESKPDGLLKLESLQPETVPNVTDDSFLNVEIGKSDYEGLLAKRDTSLLPLEEVEGQDSAAKRQTEISNGEGVPPKPEMANTCEKSSSPSKNDDALSPATATSPESSAAAYKRPSSRERKAATPQAAMPTGRPALPAKSKPSRASTPTSRATPQPPRARTPTSRAPLQRSDASVATTRATLPASKTMPAQARSSIPSRSASRSSTPASRPTMQTRSKSAPRSAPPTCKPATPPTTLSASSCDKSSSGRKTCSTMLKNPLPSRGTLQALNSSSSRPSEMFFLSYDAPRDPKPTMPKRPASATRARPSARPTQLLPSNGKPRQKSCSSAEVRPPNGNAQKMGNMTLSRSRGHGNGNGNGDDVNPVMMGTKIVERVVNMRKLAPPKQDGYSSLDNPRKSSQKNVGFGRSLSKKSLDMALRHMDIRRSIPDNLRPVATSVLSSSVPGTQRGSSKSSTVSVSQSPVTSSSSNSSKSSNYIDSYFMDSSRMGD